MKRLVLLLLLSPLFMHTIWAQHIAINHSLSSNASGSDSGVEAGLNLRRSTDLPGGYHPWVFYQNRKWKFLSRHPEARYWLYKRFGGPFAGAVLPEESFRGDDLPLDGLSAEPLLKEGEDGDYPIYGRQPYPYYPRGGKGLYFGGKYRGYQDPPYWNALREMVATCDSVPYRGEILRIIDTVPLNRGRKKQLKMLHQGVPYRWMKEHFHVFLREKGYAKSYFEKDL